jgi:hypothetical protein
MAIAGKHKVKVFAKISFTSPNHEKPGRKLA